MRIDLHNCRLYIRYASLLLKMPQGTYCLTGLHAVPDTRFDPFDAPDVALRIEPVPSRRTRGLRESIAMFPRAQGGNRHTRHSLHSSYIEEWLLACRFMHSSS